MPSTKRQKQKFTRHLSGCSWPHCSAVWVTDALSWQPPNQQGQAQKRDKNKKCVQVNKQQAKAGGLGAVCRQQESARERQVATESTSLLNPLQSSGHYMYRQFIIQQFYVLPTQCIYVFCVDLRTVSDYFPIQHYLTGFCNQTEGVFCAVRTGTLN